MSRSFVLTAESTHAVDRIRAAFGSESYWQARLAAFDTGRPSLDSLTTDPDGTTTAAMTLRFGGDQLPPPLNRLHAGTLHVSHQERWRAADGDSVEGEINVDASGLPMSGHGKVSVTPIQNGSRFACTGTVAVNIPLLGGTIAKLITDPLTGGIRDIHDFTAAWIAENG